MSWSSCIQLFNDAIDDDGNYANGTADGTVDGAVDDAINGKQRGIFWFSSFG